ncbi:tyrosine-protein phosphatase non-receptor type 21-like [Sinocyclocheilus rhinocerous]|uniref:tyrosine-protein phosphatase non-receptor type 21-like n=1 Tax=Sinocyclocheilus rhinocerous TaxID=307959 RepID=UPI0007B9D63F|nr:PREDICTED: tyrosine-protein phosphatase non-receptor type 21-like [Sinocyclocheilus rhinocerous]
MFKTVSSVQLGHFYSLPVFCRYQHYLQLKKDVLEGKIPCSIEQAIHLASLAVQEILNLKLNTRSGLLFLTSERAISEILFIPQITYFSLWYCNKQNQQRWIDLEKPLKKQLDKYGLEPTVYFGVVFYVSSVTQLQQEITRYQHYLQLKKDVLEGKIPCSIEQAIHLASLAVQADLGDFNRYDSQEFLQKIVLFPMPWIQDERVVEEATQKVTMLYQNYRGLSSPEAELLYMQEVEKMEGYGEESVQAKCCAKCKLLTLYCSIAVHVTNKTLSFITLVYFTIVFYCFVFYYRQTQPAPVNTVRRRSSTRMSLPKPQPYMMPPQMHFNGHYTEPYTSSQDNLYINNQNGFYYHSQTSLDRSPHEYNGRIRNGSVYSAQSTSSLNNPQHYLQPSPMSSNPSITGSDLMRPDYVPSHRHSALIPPSYRATPDYEAVMRQKNLGMIPPAERQSHSMRNLNIGNSYAYSRPVAYSLENMRLKERKASASAAETPPPVAQAMPPTASGSDINVVLEVTKPEMEDVIYGHKKSLSDATMLVHSSGEEEEFEDDSGRHTPQSQDAVGGPEHHMTPMGRPLVDPPAYPFSHSMEMVPTGPLAYQPHSIIRKPEDMGQLPPLREPGHMVPSVSEGDLSGQGRLRQKRDVYKRPVSDVPPARRNIDGLPPAGMKKGRSEVKKVGPLKMAALNGLTLSRMPLPDEGKDDPENASNDERCKVLEQRMEQGMVFTEYEHVPKKRPNCECTIAQMPENSDRNRFQDVLPYDDTRVELVPTKENNTGYINASHIRVTVRGKEWSYIASQGPLSSTCQDFWQMVWEQGVSIIAMVTAEEEGGREKSFRYWPRLGSRHNTVTYGRFKITTRFRTDSGCYATTGLKIKHLLTGQERTVWHLQYTDWPDHGCPEDFKGFLSYLEEIQSVRRHTNSSSDPKNTNLPVLVHCSAGVGRTGVVILSEIMIACLEHNEMLDVPTVLNLLRQQRMMMVQTLSQYTFIYKVLIQFLRNSRLI